MLKKVNDSLHLNIIKLENNSTIELNFKRTKYICVLNNEEIILNSGFKTEISFTI